MGNVSLTSATNTYDDAGRLVGIDHGRGATTLAGYDCACGVANRLTSIDSYVDGISSYTYDAASQLTAADHTAQTDEAHTYDDNGNRTDGGYAPWAGSKVSGTVYRLDGTE